MTDAEENQGNPPPAAPTPAEAESTVGTGSFFAIGCTLGSLLLIAIGIAILFWLRG